MDFQQLFPSARHYNNKLCLSGKAAFKKTSQKLRNCPYLQVLQIFHVFLGPSILDISGTPGRVCFAVRPLPDLPLKGGSGYQ